MALKNEIKGIMLELISVVLYLVLIFITAIIIMR
ncbi:hypothetical protein SAMN05421659_1184 [[Clostridium] fimetarium]|uniref:Uncharacterized protein n=1 Tax=[Clostridium] fimetarium TaxID=99656 RepID=A0A1I0RLB5_9FIRM|nr:hypothetical protein SAMN05421659_1184 [[Clostridium] fimetarium]